MGQRFVASLLASLLLASPFALPARAQDDAGIADKDLFAGSLDAAFQAYTFYGPVEEVEPQERVRTIGYELAQKSRFKEFPFTFYLVEMPVPNAFALPGGQIFVTRAMMDLGLDDDMLACLLGHEISHVTERHGTRMQKRATLVGLLSQALVIGAIVGSGRGNRPASTDPASIYGIQDDGRGDIIQGTAAVSLVLGQLLLLSYSREYETEADDEGQRLAAAAGYDPNGASRLWQKMLERIPLQKAFGYWRTHPFEDSRMRSAEERSKYLKIQEQESPNSYRIATQGRLLDFAAGPKTKPELARWVEKTAIDVWPAGKESDRLRLKGLHEQKEAELAKSELARGYGDLTKAYEKEIETVRGLTPDSGFIKTAEGELAELKTQIEVLYPKAAEVLAGGVFETAFLESFLDNYPEAPQVPQVTLALGEAYSRLRQPAEAVEQFIAVLRRAPESPEAAKARLGLRNLATYLDRLAALERLSQMDEDPELQRLAAGRLDEVSKTYNEIENGADYLKRFSSAGHVEAVTTRLNTLANKLYTEVLVYQGVGDHAKALDRINQILTHAPLSPAADQLRERTALDS